MNRDNPESKRWSELIDRYLVGNISEEDFEQLSAALEKDPSLREDFLQAVQVDYVFHEESSREIPEPSHGAESLYTRFIWSFLGAAATFVIYFSITNFVADSPEKATIEPRFSLSDPELQLGKVGVIASTVDADPIKDHTLYLGEFQAEKGLFELNLNSGVVVIARAPVHLEIRGPMEIFCHRGDLRLRVPAQAKGFRILTYDREIIDHGTEFGLSISQTTSSVEVFEGEVEIVDSSSDPLRMFEGDIANWGTPPTSTVSYPEMSQFKRPSLQTPEEWKKLLSRTQQDSSLRLLYDFKRSGPWRRTIPNNAPSAPPETDGAIIGCRSDSGRWPSTHAIEFKKGTDCITIHEPRDYQNLTMITWLKIDRIDREFNSILTSLSWEKASGSIDWGFYQDGKIYFTLKDSSLNNGVWRVTKTPSLTSESMGEWICLAITYDSSNKVFRHFLNGKVIDENSVRGRHPIKLSSAQIGNWNTTETRQIRNLNGRMDFLAVWDRALKAEEVAEFYHAGIIERRL